MNNKNDWWKPGIIVFIKVSTSIAVPIVVSLFLGKYLDNIFNTAPWIFLGLTFIAFGISIFAIWVTVKKYMNELQKDEDEDKK